MHLCMYVHTVYIYIYLYNNCLTLHVYRNFYFTPYCDTICIEMLQKVIINVRSLLYFDEKKIIWWKYGFFSAFNDYFITGSAGTGTGFCFFFISIIITDWNNCLYGRAVSTFASKSTGPEFETQLSLHFSEH